MKNTISEGIGMQKASRSDKALNDLKADLHIHSKEDKADSIKYTAKELIDKAARLNFDVLSFTFHDCLFWSNDIERYAESKGILLMPGCEKIIENCEVLVYNISKEDFRSLKTFDDLRRLRGKKRNVLVIAPHPYFILSKTLGKNLERNIDVFDAVEKSWFYCRLIDRNKKAEEVAEKHSKAFIATSDCHYIENFGKSYATIHSQKDILSIVDAIRGRKVKSFSRHISFASFFFNSIRIVLHMLTKLTKSTKPTKKNK